MTKLDRDATVRWLRDRARNLAQRAEGTALAGGDLFEAAKLRLRAEETESIASLLEQGRGKTP